MTVFVCVMLVLILGVMSFINMTTDLLPNMDLPYAIAYTTYIGASPEQVEQSVTKTLESALATTSGVKNITSISQENVSIVVLEFEEGTGMDSAMIEMNASLDQIADSLPEAAGSPVLMKINPDMLPIMVLAVDSDTVCTRFIPASKPVSSVKKWIAHSEGFAKGEIHINKGAEEALTAPKATSVLLVGVTRIEGDFEKDDIVKIMNEEGVQIGVGCTAYDSEEARKQIGQRDLKPLIHYDYLYLD